MRALLLTAGLGERLRPVTNHLAKPAIPFLNVPLMTYGAQWLCEMNIKEITCNLHHLPDTIKQASAQVSQQYGCKFSFSDESQKILGSAGAIFHARQFLENSDGFIYLNGDEVIVPSRPSVPQEFLQAHKGADALATIFVTRHPEAGKTFGAVMADANGVVHGFSRPPIQEKFQHLTPYHFTGLQAFSNRLFKYARPGVSNIFYDILTDAIAQGELVRVFEDQSLWFETGNPADFVSASGQVLDLIGNTNKPQATARDWLLRTLRLSERGQTLLHREAGEANSSVLLGPGAKLDENIKVTNFAVIGDNLTVSGTGSLNGVVLINPNSKYKTIHLKQSWHNEIRVIE